MGDKITRHYRCKICEETHKVEFDTKLLEGRTQFPFPHTILHGDVKDILTIFYLDKDLQIRGVEVQNVGLSDANLFSKEQSVQITDILTTELESLRQENEQLLKENNELKEKIKQLTS